MMIVEGLSAVLLQSLMIQDNMAQTCVRRDGTCLSLLADENSGHSHPRANAHASDEYFLAVLLGDIQAGGNLTRTSYRHNQCLRSEDGLCVEDSLHPRG